MLFHVINNRQIFKLAWRQSAQAFKKFDTIQKVLPNNVLFCQDIFHENKLSFSFRISCCDDKSSEISTVEQKLQEVIMSDKRRWLDFLFLEQYIISPACKKVRCFNCWYIFVQELCSASDNTTMIIINITNRQTVHFMSGNRIHKYVTLYEAVLCTNVRHWRKNEQQYDNAFNVVFQAESFSKLITFLFCEQIRISDDNRYSDSTYYKDATSHIPGHLPYSNVMSSLSC